MMMMILAAEGSLSPIVRPIPEGEGDSEDSAEDAADNAASAAGQVGLNIEIIY